MRAGVSGINVYQAAELDETRWHQLVIVGKPFRVSGVVDAFPARTRWTHGYLRDLDVDDEVTLTHRLAVDQDTKVAWREAIDRVFQPRNDAAEGSLYLQQTHTPATLERDIPIPPFFPVNTEWEEGLINVWISQAAPGGSVTVPHYDPLDNLLCVVSGSKTVRLYAPCDLPEIFSGKRYDPRSHKAFVPSAKAELARRQVHANLPYVSESFEPLSREPYWEGTISAGESLMIPAYWVHCVTSAPGLCVAINFWTRTVLGFSGDSEREQDSLLAALAKYLNSAPSAQTLAMRYTKIQLELNRARQHHKQLDPLFHK